MTKLQRPRKDVSASSETGYFTSQVTAAQTFWSDLMTALNRYLGIIAASGSSAAAQA